MTGLGNDWVMTDLMDCPGTAEGGVDRHEPGTGERLNRLRAAVLGANDGIVSTAAVVVGVAGATSDATTRCPASPR